MAGTGVDEAGGGSVGAPTAGVDEGAQAIVKKMSKKKVRVAFRAGKIISALYWIWEFHSTNDL